MFAEAELTYAPYGWRAKIGFMLPSSCLVYEQEFAAVAAQHDGVIGISARMPVQTTDLAGLTEMNGHIASAVAQLVDADPDVVVYMCTSGSFLDGNVGDAGIRNRIESLTGKPTTSTSLAVLTALESLDVSSVVLLSPYDHEIAEREVGWLVANGVSVVDHQHLDIRDNLKRGAFPPEQSLRHALALDWASADGIFLSCANIPYAEIVDDLGASTGRLVVTSSMATTWHALGMAGVVTALDRRA